MEIEGSVRLAKMFCAARDRNVPILFRDRIPDPEIWPASGDPIVCLDYGVRCTGWLCPHFMAPEFADRSLVERAMKADRGRRGRVVAERRAILERALREAGLRTEPTYADHHGAVHGETNRSDRDAET